MAMDKRRRSLADPYYTTHASEYLHYPKKTYQNAIKPLPSKDLSSFGASSTEVNKTTVEDDYSWKTAPRVKPIPSGTSSGNRKHKPHPGDVFLIWKLRRDNTIMTPTTISKSQDLHDKVLEKIIQDKMKTTYQGDFLGTPQGYQIKDAIDTTKDWQAQVKRPLDTIARRSFCIPKQEPELVENTTRYGCNKSKDAFAFGAVPSITKGQVSSQELVTSTKTTYGLAYRKSKNIQQQPSSLSQSGTLYHGSVPSRTSGNETSRSSLTSSQ